MGVHLGILVRYDKKAPNFLGLLQLACAISRRTANRGDCCFEVVSKL